MVYYTELDYSKMKVLKNDKNFTVLNLGNETICISYDKVIAMQVGKQFFQLYSHKELTETNKKHLGIFKAMLLF